MKATDPKIVKTFASMINFKEAEQIMTEAKHEEFFQVFNPSQLLRMLYMIAMQATNIEPICVKISKRFVEEANEVQKRRNGNNKKLTAEDSEQVALWHLRVKDILNLNTSGQKKYSLLNLVVEIISVMSEFRNQHELGSENLMQVFSTGYAPVMVGLNLKRLKKAEGL